MLSMCLFRKTGFSVTVFMKFLSMTDMYILAIVGEKEAPIAVPCKVVSAN